MKISLAFRVFFTKNISENMFSLRFEPDALDSIVNELGLCYNV